MSFYGFDPYSILGGLVIGAASRAARGSRPGPGVFRSIRRGELPILRSFFRRAGSPVNVQPSQAASAPVIFIDQRTSADAARRQRGGGPGWRPPWWWNYPPRRTFDPSNYATRKECYAAAQGDSDYEDCYDYFQQKEYWDDYESLKDYYRRKTANRPIGAFLPPTVPDIPPAVRKRAVGVLARAVLRNPWLWIFWPSRTADDDTVAEPQPQPKGPPRRPRIRPGTAPAWPTPDFDPGVRPRAPKKRPKWRPRPTEEPSPLPSDVPVTQPQPVPKPAPTPTPTRPARPAPAPRPTPTPAKRFDPTPYLLPYLLQPKTPGAGPRGVSQPLTPTQSTPLEYAQPFALPLQSRPSHCPPCTETRKRSRKKRCRNPITSRRTFKRGGARFRTITRKLQCQV